MPKENLNGREYVEEKEAKRFKVNAAIVPGRSPGRSSQRLQAITWQIVGAACPRPGTDEE